MQRIIALLVTEAEVIAMIQCVQEMLYVMKILESMQLTVKKPMIVYVNNKGAVDLANGWSIGGGTKHIDVRLMFIRQLKEQGIVAVKWKSGNENVADIFTKNVDNTLFQKHLPTFCSKFEAGGNVSG